MPKIILLSLFIAASLHAEHYINGTEKEHLTKLSTQTPFSKSRTLAQVDYYKTDAGIRLGVNDQIIVAFKDVRTQLYIEKTFSLSLVDALNDKMFVYKVADKSQTLAIANRLSTTASIDFAHPDFLVQKNNRSRDPLFKKAWHLDSNRGINVEKAWQYTQGEGVIIGLYDEGIDIEHEDLRENIYGYGNYNHANGQIDLVRSNRDLNNNLYNAPAPSSSSDIWHGTSCAGLLVASVDNNRGSAGVAPKAKLLALRYADKSVSQDIKAFYAMVKEGAAVLTNSWGTYSLFPSFARALKDLSFNGRQGKGTLIFFAAGNEGCNMDEYFSFGDNGDYHCQSEKKSFTKPINDESESPYVISVAASTQYNQIAEYSNYGSSIDLTAQGSQFPASIVTTDASGSKGSTGGNYTSTFNGTSAAAPIAAATAALILSQNPDLTKEEVLDIMQSTAKKLGVYSYDANGRNDHWGHGRVDAGEALARTKNYRKIKIENFAHKIYLSMH